MNAGKLILAVSFTGLACKNSPDSNPTHSDSAIVNSIPESTTVVKIKTGSTTKYYWEPLPIRTVGDLILKDSIRPATSPVIYKMLDSLSSENKQVRQYYLRVFNKIMNKADGDLAESIGGYALTYVQNYTKEFLDNSRAFSKNQLEAWASNIGIEIYLASNQNVKEGFDQIVVLFNDNCKDCTATNRTRLKNFGEMIWRTIRENQQAEKGSN